jgi:outer membrane protein W
MKKFLLFSFLILACWSASAQRNYAYLAWDINMPLTNKEWIEDTSPHGGMVGFRYFVRDEQFSVGLDLNWTTYDQYEERQTFQTDNGAFTTDYYKYIYQYGAAVSAQYYKPSSSEIFFPYVGLGVGANYNQYTVYYNIYENSQKAWGFLVRPEAGALIKFGPDRSLGAIVAVHYDYSTAKNVNYNYTNFSSVGVKIGLMLMTRD